MDAKKMIRNWENGDYSISTDDRKLQVAVIHHYLSKQSYWSKEITLERVQKSISNSLCFGVYKKTQQIGFARCITDFATFVYLCDVFILPEYQKNNLGKWLMSTIANIKELKVKRWMLTTLDAHNLYKKTGFISLEKPELYMHILDPDFYRKVKDQSLKDDSHEKEENHLKLRAKL